MYIFDTHNLMAFSSKTLEFSNLNIVSFGNKDLPLQENFDRVTEFFSKKLIEQLSLN